MVEENPAFGCEVEMVLYSPINEADFTGMSD